MTSVPSGCNVYFRVPSTNPKKPKPILSMIYSEESNVDKAYNSVMEHLHMTQEHYLMPILVLIQGGKA